MGYFEVLFSINNKQNKQFEHRALPVDQESLSNPSLVIIPYPAAICNPTVSGIERT